MIRFSPAAVAAAMLTTTLGWASNAFAAETCQSSDAVDIWTADPLPDIRESSEASSAILAESLKPAEARAMRHVFLIDNSLSMYPGYREGERYADQPFYTDTDAYLDFIANDVGSSFRPGEDTALVMTFETTAHVWSQGGAVRPSANSVAKHGVSTTEDLRSRLSKMEVPANQPGQKSVMLGALESAKTVLAEGPGDGIIWLVTDNIYDGLGKGSETVKKDETAENRRFYEAIRDDPSYRVVVAYPVTQQSGGAWLQDTSLFVYGIYFDSDASHPTPVGEVRRLLGDGTDGVLASSAHKAAMQKYSSPSSPAPGEPFRLKPLNQDVVRISLVSDVEQLNGHQQMGQPVPLKAVLKIENLLKHRVIDTVRFRVKNGTWAGWEPAKNQKEGAAMAAIVPACANSFETEEVVLTEPIKPGTSATIEVPLTMPPVDYTLGSVSDVMEIGLNEYVVMGGVLQAELVELKSHMAIPPEAFKGTYGAESLPDVFRNPDVRSYTAQFVGRTKKIENPGTVLALGVLAGSGLGAGLLAFGMFMLRSVGRRLRVDGVDKGAISISRLRATQIPAGGRTVAKAKLTGGGSIKLSGANGYLAKRNGSGWSLSKAGEPSVTIELRTRK